ncbi:MAG: SAM-dependent methyltransferase [Patescibacteria group bacterium]
MGAIPTAASMSYVSRAGEKLEYALNYFGINPQGYICADFGSNVGGFVDCLLQKGAQKVYAVETGYGVLDWKLRNNPRVAVMERTNAMHVKIPEEVDLITIDVSWTKLEKILPNALNNVKKDGRMIALLKPHYEADPRLLRKGKLLEEYLDQVIEDTKSKLSGLGANVLDITESPVVGSSGGNREYLLLISKK